MALSDNAVVRIQTSSQPQGAAAALTNPSGDNKTFLFPFAPVSNFAGNEAVVMVSGVATGLALAATANDDEVAYTVGTAVIPSAAAADPATGIVTKAAAGTAPLTRPAAGQVNVTSVILNGDLTVSVVTGTDATNFATNRGGAGGPPFIPPTSVELGQVRLNSDTAAPVLATEILQIAGQSREVSDQPLYTIDFFTGTVEFSAALPLIHTGSIAKEIYGGGATPEYTDQRAVDFVPAETTRTASSTQIYGETIGGSTSALNAGSFTAILNDGVTDPIVGLDGIEVWVDFYPDRDKPAHILTLGRLSLARTFPVAANNQAVVNMLAGTPSRNFAA